MARLAAPLLVCLALCVFSSQARAQRRELQEAREAYAAAEYEQVRTLLYPMVGGLVPAIDDPFLVRDARRYLGAAYVLLGRVEDAENQFGSCAARSSQTCGVRSWNRRSSWLACARSSIA